MAQRAPENCPYRRVVDSKTVACNIVAEILGPEANRLPAEICETCCLYSLPTMDGVSPPLATFLEAKVQTDTYAKLEAKVRRITERPALLRPQECKLLGEKRGEDKLRPHNRKLALYQCNAGHGIVIPAQQCETCNDFMANNYLPKDGKKRYIYNADTMGDGDYVVIAWIAEAYRDDPEIEIAHHCTHQYRKQLIEVFGQTLTDEPPTCGKPFTDMYQDEFRLKGLEGRIKFRCRAFGLEETRWKRPELHIPLTSQRWANGFLRELQGRKLICLFPQTHWQPRAWPTSYWIDLAWALQETGHYPVVFLDHDDARYAGAVPRHFFGYPWYDICSVLAVADLTVGNDSGGAWVAATCGSPTLVLSGPTNPEIFGFIPEAKGVSVSKRIRECLHCHFQAPFRRACDNGCAALFELSVAQVLRQIEEQLKCGKRSRPSWASES